MILIFDIQIIAITLITISNDMIFYRFNSKKAKKKKNPARLKNEIYIFSFWLLKVASNKKRRREI